MAEEIKVKDRTLRLVQGDITDLEVESFVYYARHDLQLGSGFGTAITMRGGPKVQEELNDLAPLETCGVTVSSAGEMKANYIIHAVGPRFQEEELETKLQTTIVNSLKKAEEKGISEVAFPPMGAGFYGVPLDVSARVTLQTIKDYLAGETGLKSVIVCLLDNREFKPFASQMASLNG